MRRAESGKDGGGKKKGDSPQPHAFFAFFSSTRAFPTILEPETG